MSIKFSKKKSTRFIVCQILEQIYIHNINLQQALNYGLENISVENKGLVTEIVYGYSRQKLFLETLIVKTSNKGLPKSSRIRFLLGIAAYELLFMDKVPEYASFSWLNKELSAIGGKFVADFGTAILRALPKIYALFKENNQNFDSVAALSVYYSCPKWIVRLWKEQYGLEQAREFLAASIKIPPIGLRMVGENKFPAFEYLQQIDFGVATYKMNVELENLEHDKKIVRQSFATQAIMNDLEPRTWGQPIWDACAGSGGKTQILANMGLDVFASDPNSGRINRLQQVLDSQGFKIPIFQNNFLDNCLKTFSGSILLDVPCSGLGVLSRKPDIKWKRTPKDLIDLVNLQEKLLETAYNNLEIGGKIIYITCTLNKQENENQIEKFKNKYKLCLLKAVQTKVEDKLNEFFYGAILEKS